MTDFLTINGWNLPVADGSLKRKPDLPAKITRAASGKALAHQVARKLRIDGTAQLSDPETGAAIEGLLSGAGHRWGFNLVSGALEIYSSRGLYAYGSPISYNRPAAGADLLTSTDSYSTSSNIVPPKLGDACLWTGPALANLLTANCGDGTDTSSATTGFTARVGAGTSVLSSSTAAKWRGSRSLLATVSAHVGSGWECQYATGVASTQYVGAVYLLAASGTPQVDVWVRDETAGADGTKVRVTLSTTVWRRVEAAHTTSGAGGPHVVKLIVETAGTGGEDFYADELLLGASATPHAGAWTAGGSTRTATNLLYRLNDLSPTDDFTIMAWVRTNLLSGGLSGLGQVLFQIGDSTTNCVSIAGQLGDDAVTTQIDGVAGAHEDFGILGDLDGAWTHIALVVRRIDGSITTFQDGVATGAAATGSLPAFTAPNLAIGSDLAGAHIFEGMIDEVVFVPWAMSAEQIAAWYTREFSDLPRLDVAGNVIAGTAVEMEMLSDGEAITDEYVQASDDGTWSSRFRRVTFGLREV